ncbi:HD domain-containing protein [Christensenellaceae bacterium OttesenSCG-928-K19]|nr:HD domain-containing protein [Christensenellaceae bacterium OttesenSCG-928-K19]
MDLKTICLIAVFAGAAILLVSMIKYYRALVNFRLEAHEKKVFSRWTYGLCMVLMLMFFIGYVALGVTYSGRATLTLSDLLVAGIFFFGAVFVYVVVTVQGQMSRVIAGKTDEMVRTLVNAMEAKDQYTRGHSIHVLNLVKLFYAHLPDKLKRQINYPYLLDAALRHDIGKIGISDYVLNKPGALDEEEWKVIRQHPRLGKQILEQTSFKGLGNAILCHHERMDQQGYYRIPADQVPLESKIIAIADTFSALYTDRVYRPRKSLEDALAILREVAGTQLDADLVEIFCNIPKQQLKDSTRDLFVMEHAAI